MASTTLIQHETATLEPVASPKRGKSRFTAAAPASTPRKAPKASPRPSEQLSDWDHAS